MRARDLIIWTALVASLALYPRVATVDNYRLLRLTQLLVLVSLASSWNLIGGMTGYVDFGHAVFFGIGAYAMGIAVTPLSAGRLEWAPELPYGAGLALAGLAAALFALAIGLPLLRLKGPYFSIAMLGTFMAVRELVRIAKPWTGGGEGLDVSASLDRRGDYYAMLGLVAFVVGLAAWVRSSQLGLALEAIREDEVGAETRGIATTRIKLATFALAAGCTGLVGGFWSVQNNYVDPDVAFIEHRTAEMVMMAMLGGLGTVWGPVLGAVALDLLKDYAWSRFLDDHLAVLGVSMILVVLLLPRGIMGALSSPRLVRWARRAIGRRSVEPEA